jgi:hypothetical protein
MSNEPVSVPLLTNVLIAKIHAANEEAGPRAKAFDTPFRYSDAGKCARQIGFASLGYRQTEPMDLAGSHVTWLGTLMHEKLQEALLERYPDAEVEGTSSLGSTDGVQSFFTSDLTSGHFDALLTLPDGRLCLYELKTKGTYGFDLAVGILRKQWKRQEPEGPGMGAKIQGALNAVAAGADLLVIGVIGFEAISKGFAEKIGCSEEDRIMAEWHYEREEFEPWALAELDRLREIKDTLDHETLPARWGIDDDGNHVEFDPAKEKFPCTYCSYLSLCRFAGPGPVPLPIPGMKELVK